MHPYKETFCLKIIPFLFLHGSIILEYIQIGPPALNEK